MKHVLVTALITASGIIAPHTQAEADWASVVWQNDVFVNVDGGGYTNGLFLSWYDLTTEGEGYRQPWLTKSLSWMLDQNSDALNFSEQTIGQAMVTPLDISQEVPDPNDVPYAGLLFYRASHAIVEENFADLVSVTVGMVGPASMAEESQKFVHKITGSTEPKGWDYQLKNEPIFAFSRTAVWRYELAHYMDTVIMAQGELGTMQSAVGGGALLRLGTRLDKSFPSTALHRGEISAPASIDGGWYVYAGFEADYVFNNILVDGNTYRNSPDGDLKHEQLMATAGISYGWEDISLTLSFRSGDSVDKADTSRDEFGALTLAWRL
ncbi:lipid A deacylase LpxR family protein [Gilvimarinus agarilyticus]|uniref:lipid A deacylase LpxR family protein n=1 Tax=unclassified Gilvimarinus TaxID=2642066 RepID=UPI001C091C37|nr:MULTISPECIES: lipid A deacylase LpxR family protein [unclassified Gilvimarinus]MBU2886264.1 lipid A deacylase LpxR family protein [Gilvimarinus agarilyticus]MDO6570952.1 lipid A deacylase LpxR family protein [Gilvimarinus sp. 2_MG-2023]MDO6747761.1 lipid A deacylase LpxR family protein [Gilvimarinus sp. 1_MG-2023]